MKKNKWLWAVDLAAVLIIVLTVVICIKGANDKKDKADGDVKKVVENNETKETVTETSDIDEDEAKDEDNAEPEVYENPLTFKNHAISLCSYPKLEPYPEENSDTYWDDMNKWYDSCKELDLSYATMILDGEINYDEFYTNSIREFIGSTDDENLVYSPLNVQMALSMLAEITDGNSRQQILDALGIDSIEALREQTNAIWKANYSADGPATNILANSIWLADSVNYNKETLDTLAGSYYASSFSGVMGSAKYNKALQDWLNENTGNMLSDQISQLEMNQQTIATLASTVYFRAKWEDTFSESATKLDTFYGVAGEKKCNFMNTSGQNEYYWGDKFTAVSQSLAYSGAMWFILPDEGVTVNELIRDEETMEFMLSNGDWANRKNLIVNMSVPKFDVSSQIQLENGLKGLGITDVFDMGTSDFTPLTTDTEEIEISEAQHGARVTIDEEGCIATAYTVMIAAGSAVTPDEEVDFVVNRPFLFVITSDYGMPLFVGVVNNVE